MLIPRRVKHRKQHHPSPRSVPKGGTRVSFGHYGIQGTPESSNIGHVESHGCVWLTNWDADRVAQWAKAGTQVVFRE